METIDNIAASAILPISWPNIKVKAFTTTRGSKQKLQSVVSGSPYGYFNLGLHVGDNAEAVEANRQALLNFLPENTHIQWLEQVHGGDVYNVTNYSPNLVQADAAYTDQQGIALAIMTADCLPILISSADGLEVAAIHAGWRPLAKEIIKTTIAHFKAPTQQLVAWLGPCIGPSAFEVGAEVKQAFTLLSADNEQAFVSNPNKTAHYFANLQQLARIQLNALGIKQVFSQNECTYSLPEKYYSYRREAVTGRMVSIIFRP